MSKESKTWFAATAFAGLTFSLINAGTVVAQRGGPPNVTELFSRMDRNHDGKLTESEVPEPVWNRLSHADTDRDGGVTRDEAARALPGRRPEGGRPDAGRSDAGRPDAGRSDAGSTYAGRPDAGRPDAGRPDAGRPDAGRPDAGRPDGGRPNVRSDARSRQDQSRGRSPRPPMEQEPGASPRDQPRGQRDAFPERGRPAPPRSSDQPQRDQSGRRDSADRGAVPFAPDAYFDRLDKNRDGSLSREEFRAVAEFHRGQQVNRGPIAERGPDMRGGGPPWARRDGGSRHGSDRFQGGPPWARPGFGPPINRNFAGPPWARSTHRDHGSHRGAAHEEPRHQDGESRDPRSRERER